VQARYMFVDARYSGGTFDGHMVPYAPEHTLVVNASVDHPSGVSGHVAYGFVSEQYADGANTVMPTADGRNGQLGAYHTLDLVAGYAPRGSGFGFQLAAKNLLDIPYVATRFPDGIQPAGFRQVMLLIRYEQ
jgi:outer membrane receptor protein involved in Fe transport